jgi:hypothetical protein
MASCRLVLHLGAHRTGTTVLQAALDQALPVLNALGVDAIVPPGPKRRKHQWMRRYYRRQQRRYAKANGFSVSRALIAPLILQHFRRKLQQNVDRRSRTLILSDEEFLGPVVDVCGDAGLYPRSMTWLLLLGDLAKTYDTSIFLGIRSYADFLLSAYLMDSVYGRRTYDFAPFHGSAMNLQGGWVRLVDGITCLFPGVPVTLWPHETIDIARRFRDITGIDAAQIRPLDRVELINASPTREAIEAVRQAAACGRLTKADCDAFVEKHAGGVRSRLEDVFERREIELLQEAYDAHLERLRAMPGVTVV